jgi:hypothetical protein
MTRSFVKRGADRFVPDTELSLFSYEILGLVGREGAGPHDLLRLAKRGRVLAWAGESQYYTEPRAHRLHPHRQGPRSTSRLR